MKNREIIDAIRVITGTKNKQEIIIGECTVQSYNNDMSGNIISVNCLQKKSNVIVLVPIQYSIGNSVICIPTLQSTVIVVSFQGGEMQPFILSYSDIDTLYLNTNGNIYLNASPSTNNKGLPLAPYLLQQLNNLENLVVDLIKQYNNAVTTFNSHTHTFTGVAVGAQGTTIVPSGSFSTESNTINNAGSAGTTDATTADKLENKTVFQ